MNNMDKTDMQSDNMHADHDVMQPIERAKGLPNRYYTDQAHFDLEKQQLFYRQWACIGFKKDLFEDGMAIPVTLLDVPLLMVRDKHGTVRVFQNVCRHRGMILVDRPTKLTNLIRCPYHSWCYSLEGKLRSTPHFGGSGKNKHESLDPNQFGLIQVRAHLFMDMIFVNLSGDAADFDHYASSLGTRWHEFTNQKLVHGGEDASFELTLNTNWKLAVENYCESYHLPWIHPALNSYSKLEDHYTITADDGKHAGQGTVVYNPYLEDQGRVFPNFQGLSSAWDKAAEYIALFPNVLLGVHRDHYFAIHLNPVAVNKTVERVELYYAHDDVILPEWEMLKKTHAEMWRKVFEEDIYVVEGMQQGRSAPGFDGGKFSPVLDTGTHCFHKWVASNTNRKA
ncbi:MAG: aromatic ring-hydroxylating dioxygenase subunit alpha [Alphaproteobacteria bacterium]